MKLLELSMAVWIALVIIVIYFLIILDFLLNDSFEIFSWMINETKEEKEPYREWKIEEKSPHTKEIEWNSKQQFGHRSNVLLI